MLRAVLMTMWRWTRWVVVVLSVAGFAIPVLTAANLGGLHMAELPVSDVLSTFSAAGLVFIPLAIVLGITLGAGAWSADMNLGFVYMLVHPVPRWYLVLLRYASGALLLVIPVLAVLLGCLVVTLFGNVPEFVRAYPASLTVRFAGALLFTYSIMFGATGSGRGRASDGTADVARALISLGLGVVAIASLVAFDRLVLGAVIEQALLRWLSGPWSPLGIIVGRWGLFDV